MGELHDEVTPEGLYHSRRAFLKAAGFVGAGSLLAAACRGEQVNPTVSPMPTPTPKVVTPGVITDELGDPLTPYEDVTGINNFYEFTLSKTAVKEKAADFDTSGWTVAVGGLVENPQTFSTDELLSFEQEERIYRLRCVEGWSMVIPWQGFPLSALLEVVNPTSEARFVRFETLLDEQQMPAASSYPFPWPYVEGLRLDEANHPLAILATGAYGKPLPPQSGAPIRLVVPWKYGFKSIKSIIKIDLVAERPLSFWSRYSYEEYGFFANVNPEVDHPRWSQATELRIGDSERRPTLLFNGYADQVAHLYAGMDLRENY